MELSSQTGRWTKYQDYTMAPMKGQLLVRHKLDGGEKLPIKLALPIRPQAEQLLPNCLGIGQQFGQVEAHTRRGKAPGFGQTPLQQLHRPTPIFVLDMVASHTYL